MKRTQNLVKSPDTVIKHADRESDKFPERTLKEKTIANIKSENHY